MITLIGWLSWAVPALVFMRPAYRRILEVTTTPYSGDNGDRVMSALAAVVLSCIWPAVVVFGSLFLYITYGNKTKTEKQRELKEKEMAWERKIAELERVCDIPGTEYPTGMTKRERRWIGDI